MRCLGCKIKAALTLRRGSYRLYPHTATKMGASSIFPPLPQTEGGLGQLRTKLSSYDSGVSHSPSLGDSDSVQLGCGSGIVPRKLHHLNMQSGLEAVGAVFRIPQLEGDCSGMISGTAIKKKNLLKTNLGREGGLFAL